MLYIVTHSHYNPEYNLYNEKFIWVFSSKELVDSIVWYKSRNEDWFKAHPNGFKVSKLSIDDDKNFVYRLWKTKLYLLLYSEPDTERILCLGIYSTKKLAKIRHDTLLDTSKYKKKQLDIKYVILDLELWRDWFISTGEALDSF